MAYILQVEIKDLDLLLRTLLKALDFASVDSAGNLRVTLPTSLAATQSGTWNIATLTNVGAGYPGAALAETMSDIDYHEGFRKNLTFS